VRDRELKPHWYYILLSLAEENRHGLAIARDVEALSDGRVRLWPASLYGSLAELSDRGWIDELAEGRRPSDESERRRIYRLTRTGRAVLEAETRRLAALVRTARARVKPRTRESS
jgi:DNA-binding PadR family transcriptional regulator